MTPPGATAAGFRLALGTLTIIPVGDVGQIRPAVARAAMLCAPVAALPLGLVTAGICLLGSLFGLPGLVVGGLVVGWLGLGTRGMHLDGLADTVDGLAAGWDRERALAVMRSGDVGPLGVVALIVVLLTQAGSIAALVTSGPLGAVAVAWAVVASRGACAAMTLSGLPPARPEGLGAAVAGTVPAPALAMSVAGLAALGVASAVVAGSPWWTPLVGVLMAGAVLAWLARTALRVVGGINGDLIGAAVELSLTCLLVTLCVGVA